MVDRVIVIQYSLHVTKHAVYIMSAYMLLHIIAQHNEIEGTEIFPGSVKTISKCLKQPHTLLVLASK